MPEREAPSLHAPVNRDTLHASSASQQGGFVAGQVIGLETLREYPLCEDPAIKNIASQRLLATVD